MFCLCVDEDLCFLESGGKNMMVNKQTTTTSFNRNMVVSFGLRSFVDCTACSQHGMHEFADRFGMSPTRFNSHSLNQTRLFPLPIDIRAEQLWQVAGSSIFVL
jgi:hypothetical protein